MSSSGLIFDKLYHGVIGKDDTPFTLWATYHLWQSKYHNEGFRLACVADGHFFTWDTHELRKAAHPAYTKVVPDLARIDEAARKHALDFLIQHADFDELMHRAEAAQRHWNEVEDLDDPGHRLQVLWQRDQAEAQGAQGARKKKLRTAY